MWEFFSKIESVNQVVNYLKASTPYERSLHIAYWLIPIVIGSFWYLTIEKDDYLDNLKNRIIVVPLNSTISKDKQSFNKKGVIVVLNEFDNSFKIPLKKNILVEKFWTSLMDSSLHGNHEKITISDNTFYGNMPLYGNNNIIGVVIEGEPEGDIKLPGKSIAISKLLPQSTFSVALVSWVFLSVAFGFGLLFSDISREH